MILPFRMQRQWLNYWCWAAVSSSVSLYYNPSSRWRQNVIAASLIASNCGIASPQNPSETPGECNIMLDLSEALTLTRNYVREVSRPLTMAETISQINGGWVICCQMNWIGIERSHFVAIYGYSGNDLLIADPEVTVPPYDYFAFRDNYRGGGRWIRSIGTQRDFTS